jgi:stage II sporulation protein AA (anti-sigma F factor antagonist)
MTTWQLRCQRQVEEDVLVLTVAGRIGAASAPQLIEALVAAVEGGDRRILVDLGGVDYLSSAGVIALEATAGRVYAAGGRLVLCDLAEPVRLALQLAGRLGDFDVARSRAAGIERLREGAIPPP